MPENLLLPPSGPYTASVGRRHKLTLVTIIATVVLLAWGAFVTSIDAGLAVPDWPTSFNSFDPFNPWPEWWTVTPVLAEHGHRLAGGLVGLLTLALAAWTFFADRRAWMRYLAIGALVTVIIQGILGGLRVIWTSSDLAIVHACVAQVFFALIVTMALVTSRGWYQIVEGRTPSPALSRLKGFVAFTAGAVYLQIVFGALLRHPGTGIDLFLTVTHVGWAIVVAVLVIATAFYIAARFREDRLLRKTARVAVGLLVVQFALGLTAFLVNLDEAGYTVASNFQVIVNSSHMVIGALLMSATVCQVLLSLQGQTTVNVVETEQSPSAPTADRVPATA